MPSKISQLEKRLDRIEQELKELKAAVAPEPKIPWWREIEGGFKDDPVFADIVRRGAEIRKRDRKGRR